VNKQCTTCFNVDLDKLIYEIKFTIDKLSTESIKSKLYGYSCDKKADDKIEQLCSYLNVIQCEYRRVSRGAEPCLSAHNMQLLTGKVRRVTASCNINIIADVDIDKSQETTWVAYNPACVSREKWECLVEEALECCELRFTSVLIKEETFVERDGVEYLLRDSGDIPDYLKLQINEKECDLVFEITRNIIKCDVLIAISAYSKACDLNLTVKKTEEQCQIELQLLKERVDSCDLDLKTYKKLIDCNLTFDIISCAIENGCTFEVGATVPVLVTALNKYPLDDFKFNGIPDIKALVKYGADIKNSKYLKNPTEFINTLNSDYSE
jgi:hypothetical protein